MTTRTRTVVAAAITAAVAVLAVAAVVVLQDDAEPGAAARMGDRPLLPTPNPAPARGKAGPNLAVDPADESHIVELHQELVTSECEVNVSFDRGRTWTGSTLEPPAGYPSGSPGPCTLVRSTIANLSQQALAFGSGRDVFVAWAASVRPSSHGLTVLLSRSRDGGVTFAPAVEIPGMVGGIAPAPDFARPELAVDRRGPGTDRLYVAARNVRSAQALVVRSDDGGTTWAQPHEATAGEPSRNPPPTFATGSATVTSAGDAYISAVELTQPVLGLAPAGGGERPLHVGWVAANAGPQCPPYCEAAGETGADGYLVVATSTDAGQTWARTRVVNLRGAIGPDGTTFRGSSFPRMAAAPDGALHVVFGQGAGTPPSASCGTGPYPAGAPGASATPCPAYQDREDEFRGADHTISYDADVWYIRSTDGGATWNDLRQINDGKRPGLVVPEITQTRHPQVAVTADGVVHITWEDRRHWYLSPSVRRAVKTPAYRCVHTHAACEEGRLGDTYHAWSVDGGATLSPNRRLNDRSHNNDVGFDHRMSTYRDYGPTVVALGSERLLVADMDSRLGNAASNSLDIFLREVSLTRAAGPVPVERLVTGDAPAFTVGLSQLVQPGGAEAVLAAEARTRPATSVVIVNEADPAAALVGGVLARAHLGPLLASPAKGLPDVVRDEVDRLDPVRAYVIGDVTKLGLQVQADLAAAGLAADAIVRISGVAPADVAAAVARALDTRSAEDKANSPPVPAFDAAVLVAPDSPSAPAAAALAASRRLPVLHLEGGTVPASTRRAVADLGVTKTLIVGAPALAPEQEASLPGPKRLDGADRYEVSSSVLTESVARGLPSNIVYVADGNEPMHAALLGAAVARVGGLLLLEPDGSTEEAERTLGHRAMGATVDRLVFSDLTGTASRR